MNILTGEHPVVPWRVQIVGLLHGNDVVPLWQAKGGAVRESTPCN